MLRSCARSARSRRRLGATVVEVAVVFPVFLAFVFGLFEFGRLMMVVRLLDSATRNAARYGATEGITSSQTQQSLTSQLAVLVDPESISTGVKDASVYEGPGPYPASGADFCALPGVELSTVEPRQPFLVHAGVEYNDIAILPFPFMEGVTLVGHAVMRHE